MENKRICSYLLDVSSIDEESFEKLLSGIKYYRKEKILKLSLKETKKLSLGVELLIKKACFDFGISYEDTEIVFNEYGKPYFKNSKYFFNTAHSGKYAICVISDKEVGIDIEEIKDFKDKVAKRYFTSKENQYIELSNEKVDLFYRLWTFKESYVKCLGKGLSIPLNSIELVSKNNNVVISGDKTHQFYETKIENYRIAWCLNIPEKEKKNYSSKVKVINF